MTPRLVTFEGGEGSGKSTQARRVAEARGALLTHQPGGTTIGASIREVLLSPSTEGLSDRAEALLMAADRAQHVAEVIRPALAAGRDVICDRYVDSSLAYQGAGRELGIDAVRELSTFAVDGVWPDLTVLLDVPPEVGMRRIDGVPDRLEQQAVDFHERVRDAYRSLAAADPERWAVIDASAPVDAVASELDAVLADRIGWHLTSGDPV